MRETESTVAQIKRKLGRYTEDAQAVKEGALQIIRFLKEDITEKDARTILQMVKVLALKSGSLAAGFNNLEENDIELLITQIRIAEKEAVRKAA